MIAALRRADDGDADDEKDEKESRRELPAPAPNQPSIAEVDEKVSALLSAATNG